MEICPLCACNIMHGDVLGEGWRPCMVLPVSLIVPAGLHRQIPQLSNPNCVSVKSRIFRGTDLGHRGSYDSLLWPPLGSCLLHSTGYFIFCVLQSTWNKTKKSCLIVTSQQQPAVSQRPEVSPAGCPRDEDHPGQIICVLADAWGHTVPNPLQRRSIYLKAGKEGLWGDWGSQGRAGEAAWEMGTDSDITF